MLVIPACAISEFSPTVQNSLFRDCLMIHIHPGCSVPWVSVGMVETEKLALERWSALESDPSMSHHKGRQWV